MTDGNYGPRRGWEGRVASVGAHVMGDDSRGRAFLGLAPTEDPAVWLLPVSEGITGGRGQLFGGCGLGAAVEVLERFTGRPVVWATGQFVASAFPPDVVRVEVSVLAEGRNFVQAQVAATVEGRLCISVMAALGQRPFDDSVDRLQMPAVTGPSTSEPYIFEPSDGRLGSRLECRVACLTDSSAVERGAGYLWFRFPGASAGSPALQAIAGDFVPLVLTSTFGRPMFGSSLDNTIRYLGRADVDWILADLAVDWVRDGVGHVSTSLWTETGQCLAVCSQTCVVSER